VNILEKPVISNTSFTYGCKEQSTRFPSRAFTRFNVARRARRPALLIYSTEERSTTISRSPFSMAQDNSFSSEGAVAASILPTGEITLAFSDMIVSSSCLIWFLQILRLWVHCRILKHKAQPIPFR